MNDLLSKIINDKEEDNYIKLEYEIIPDGSYEVLRNCAKCGCKTKYVNTNRFRINANGNKVDVWLIYQCEKCKHTYNLTIYERSKPHNVKDYERFLANDEYLAKEFGNNKELFERNKATINYENISYKIEKIDSTEEDQKNLIVIHNPFDLKIRTEKVLSEILSLSRCKIKDLCKEERIIISHNYLKEITEIKMKFDPEMSIC